MRDGESIRNSPDDGRQRPHRSTLARALGPKRIGRTEHFVIGRLYEGNITGARQGVIHEACRHELPGFAVIYTVLHQHLAEPLGDPAMHLALCEERIDDTAEIIDHLVPHDLDLAGLLVNLDFADMAAIREGEETAIVRR